MGTGIQSPVSTPDSTEQTHRKRQPRYHVVLLDDDEHSYEYVIRMLAGLFGKDEQTAFVMAREVDETGRVVVLTTNKEHAEFKQDQVHGFGADPLIPICKGSMSAILEPALEN